ncbi:sulfotransferase family protein [Solicola gregarius]|uniref:Sulfotransferase n=1 Tax=Solicola gregarius TaxID=2908642 RepID=A0AA46YME6_9ACTN|nr:sulfotransferase [Solicola gregarius]UYM06554.1 sulfotransferase [Solicola gregarius]
MRRGTELGRRGLLRASEALAAPTAFARLEPTFLIVGAQRCGTTSMFKTLIQHPDIVRPFLRKGIHYFDKNYDRPENWYRGHFPLRAAATARHRGRTAQTGESSPYYMFHPHAADRIAGDLPDARLIMLLRDPVERAYSAHAHELARGFETLDFEAAIAEEPSRLDGEWARMANDASYDSRTLQHNAYLARGRYIEQIERVATAVGRERLLVVDSGDFFATPEPVFEEVREFLGLGPANGIRFERHNSRPRSTMDEHLRAELRRSFETWDARLAEWWGRTPSWRR